VVTKENRCVWRFAPTILFFVFAGSVPGCGGDGVTTPPPSGFDGQIEVRYVSAPIPSAVDVAVKSAVDKWTRALHKNIGDFRLQSPAAQCFDHEPQLNEVHHNLVVFVSVLPVDGPSNELAYTDVCQVSDRDQLPIVSHIRLDSEDVPRMQSDGKLQAVVMHEMGHALGFNPKTYLPRNLAAGGRNDPVFTGARARAEFAAHGAWYTGVTVPLEDASGVGPSDPHWRFRVFGDELMVGAIATGFKAPLSTITLGFFQDIGYDVDFSVADPYEVVPLFPGDRILPQETLKSDFRMTWPAEALSPLIVKGR